jgi:hypothetical protein
MLAQATKHFRYDEEEEECYKDKKIHEQNIDEALIFLELQSYDAINGEVVIH